MKSDLSNTISHVGKILMFHPRYHIGESVVRGRNWKGDSAGERQVLALDRGKTSSIAGMIDRDQRTTSSKETRALFPHQADLDQK